MPRGERMNAAPVLFAARTDAALFGNNGDFGMAIDASGFYSGTPGVAGTNDLGFDRKDANQRSGGDLLP